MVSWIKGHRSQFFKNCSTMAWEPPPGNPDLQKALHYKHQVSRDTNSSQLRNKAETTDQHNRGSQIDQPSVSQTDQERIRSSPDGPAWPQMLRWSAGWSTAPRPEKGQGAASGDAIGEEQDGQAQWTSTAAMHRCRGVGSLFPAL